MRVLKEFRIPVPYSIEEQERVASRLEKQMAQIETIRKEAEKKARAIIQLPQAILNEEFGKYGIPESAVYE